MIKKIIFITFLFVGLSSFGQDINELRKKVSSLQKDRNKLLEKVAKDRRKAKNELLKNLNPLIKEYMVKNKIRYVNINFFTIKG